MTIPPVLTSATQRLAWPTVAWCCVLMLGLKFGLAVGLAAWVDTDYTTTEIAVQTGGYAVVLLATLFARRAGLLLASAYLAYTVVAGLVAFGVASHRLVALLSSVLLTGCLLAFARSTTGDVLRPSTPLVLALVTGLAAGAALSPLTEPPEGTGGPATPVPSGQAAAFHAAAAWRLADKETDASPD